VLPMAPRRGPPLPRVGWLATTTSENTIRTAPTSSTTSPTRSDGFRLLRRLRTVWSDCGRRNQRAS